jgi:AmmeMemoRadiSam system protein A
MLSEEQRVELLGIARVAIANRADHGAVAFESTPTTWPNAGAFVTLRKQGELRGCIGHVEPDRPLDLTVARVALAAAQTDPRFPPVSLDELDEISIEISVLGPLERIAGLNEIAVGRHGLVVERTFHRGLLLPQVAVEQGWSAEVFASQTCVKAGLPPDAWKQGAALWRFDAEVFGESGADEVA